MVDNRKTALITGGEGDLARALSGPLSNRGWNVLCPGRNELDVRQEDHVTAWFSKIDSLDLLIHNAAVVEDGLLPQMTEGSWDNVVETSLRGAFLCSQAALSLMMRARQGHILFISSWVGRHGRSGQSNYAAAKAGLIGLSQSIAREYGRRNICCNVIVPGFLETKMNRHLNSRQRDEILSHHALGRFATLEETAESIAFLAEQRHISGQCFQLDSRVG